MKHYYFSPERTKLRAYSVDLTLEIMGSYSSGYLISFWFLCRCFKNKNNLILISYIYQNIVNTFLLLLQILLIFSFPPCSPILVCYVFHVSDDYLIDANHKINKKKSKLNTQDQFHLIKFITINIKPNSYYLIKIYRPKIISFATAIFKSIFLSQEVFCKTSTSLTSTLLLCNQITYFLERRKKKELRISQWN